MQTLAKTKTGLYFVDSTTIKVCHIKREKQHKVFSGLAKKSRSTLGWFFGFKRHSLVNSIGELMAVKLTEVTTDDRVPVGDLGKGLCGKLSEDKRYISKALQDKLLSQRLELITNYERGQLLRVSLVNLKILARLNLFVIVV